MRNVRRDAMHHLKDLEKNGEAQADEVHRAEDRVQKLTDEHVKLIDERPEAQGSRDPRGLGCRSARPEPRRRPCPESWSACACSARRRGPTSRRCPRSRGRSRSSWTATGAGPAARPARARRPPRRDARAAAHRRGRIDLGVDSLSVYAFSTENWNRARRRGARPARPARRDDPARVPGPGPQGVRVRFVGRRDRCSPSSRR